MKTPKEMVVGISSCVMNGRRSNFAQCYYKGTRRQEKKMKNHEDLKIQRGERATGVRPR